MLIVLNYIAGKIDCLIFQVNCHI